MCSVTRYIPILFLVFFNCSLNCIYIFHYIQLFLVQAIKELNIKTKNWKELLTDEPFSREDIITIQVKIQFTLLLMIEVHAYLNF